METFLMLAILTAAVAVRLWASVEFAKFIESAPADVRAQFSRTLARGDC